MKILKKIIISLTIAISFFAMNNNITFAENIKWFNDIKNVNNEEKTLKDTIESTWWKIIDWVRYIFSAVLITLIIYSWVRMVMSMWTDDDSLSKAKRSFRYALIWIIFINFPKFIYDQIATNRWDWNFVNLSGFSIILQNILTALEILILWVSIFILVLEWIKLITWARNNDNAFDKSKWKIKWVVLALIFLWFIELWKSFLWSWSIDELSTNIFSQVANLALYISAPIALFFLTLAWYYYIFSNWDEGKTKKWKNIIINTSVWVVILLCLYVLLNDISLLKF